MAGYLSCTEKGNVSPENVKRWTEKLSNVLISTTARNKFKSYLTKREFEEGQSLVEFWEICGIFLKKVNEERHNTHRRRKENLELDVCCTKTGAADGVDQSAVLLLEEAEKIVEFAEEKIDFDAQMIRLKAALRSEDIGKLETAISDAQQSAAEKLTEKGHYKAFCQYLLQGQGD